MKKKYIVELGRCERLYRAYVNGNGKPNLTWLSPEVDLPPYTEPDLERVKKTAHDDGYSEGYQAGREDLNRVMSDVEQVRKEAYDKGYSKGFTNAKVQCNIQAEKDMREVGERHYQKGLSDAWEAARKIANMPYGEEERVFGSGGWAFITKHTASEAIEKIRQYEQTKEEIKVGDEVAFHHDDGRPDTVVVVTYVGQDGFIDGMDGRGTQYAHKNPKKWTKTGRHFPDIAEVLDKMREGQEQ